MRIKAILLASLICFLSSCLAGADYQRSLNSLFQRDLVTTGSDYQMVLDSWIGFDIDLLVRRWGKPTKIFPTRSGTTIHVFSKSENQSQPFRVYKHIFKALPDATYTTTFKSKYGFSALPEYISLTRQGLEGQEILRMSCETLFEVDEGNSITHWSYRGYDCY